MASKSCDTFVVLPPLTSHGVVFGKNSDRPQNEVQELVYFPASDSSPDTVQCTYIEVEAGGPRKAIILSKPGWMWGAEMGANECGVAIGNESVWTKENDEENDTSVKRLLGMDLVRLGLERGSSASEALDVITGLLEKYGQGGPCQLDNDLSHNNSFLIADTGEAWILETSGKNWAAVQITSGYRNISKCLTITTKIDKHSDGLIEYAKEKGLWDGDGEFNFAKAFGTCDQLGEDSQKSSEDLLKTLSESKDFKETDMFTILRNTETVVCRSFPAQGSQVSTLSATRPSVHWFTATPDPSKSVFKPFVFTPNAVISKHTMCPEDEKSGEHTLYSLHKDSMKDEGNEMQKLLFAMEADCVKELNAVVESVGDDLSELDELLKDCVETEVKFYR